MINRFREVHRKGLDRNVRGCTLTARATCPTFVNEEKVVFFINKTNVVLTSENKRHTFNVRKSLRCIFLFQKVKYRFAGKAYRVKFSKNMVRLKFHRSHPTLFYYNPKKIELGFRKNKWVFFKTKYPNREFTNIRRCLDSVRPKNIYTNRGFWRTKALFYKKKGKISGYR